MDQIRQEALAHYSTFTDDQKRKADDIFRLCDKNGDGKVSISEFKKFIGTYDSTQYSFQQLDTNGDGELDSEEFITLGYLISTGRVTLKKSKREIFFGSESSKRQKLWKAIKAFNQVYAFGQAAAACSIM